MASENTTKKEGFDAIIYASKIIETTILICPNYKMF